MDDDAFLSAFDLGALHQHGFGHRDHLRMAWLYVHRHGQDEAVRRAETGLRQLAALHGHPERCSATRTAVWVGLVAHHLQDAQELGFEQFLERFPGCSTAACSTLTTPPASSPLPPVGRVRPDQTASRSPRASASGSGREQDEKLGWVSTPPTGKAT